MSAGMAAEASEIFRMIVDRQPDWEHGQGFYCLACCQEDLGQLEQAEKYFRAALEFEPQNDIFLGGIASFLYLHGNAGDAFEAYLELLAVETKFGFNEGTKRAMIGLKTLGERLGLSEAEMIQRTEAKLAARG